MVRLELTEPLAQLPTGFAIQSPARIALDFPSTTNGLSQSLVELQQGNIQSANVVEASGRTRVVLNLKTATGYRTELDGNAVLIYLDPVKECCIRCAFAYTECDGGTDRCSASADLGTPA